MQSAATVGLELLICLVKCFVGGCGLEQAPALGQTEQTNNLITITTFGLVVEGATAS